MDVLFTFAFICIFIACGYVLFRDDDDHDEWRKF
jgi:cbb3-type cytochrome oxidase subunit 3